MYVYDGVPKRNDFEVGARFDLPSPTLIIGAGIGGVGKSTFFRPLARAINDAVYIDKDTLSYSYLWSTRAGERTDMGRYIPKDRIAVSYSDHSNPHNRYYGTHVCLQTYHCMLMIARQLLSLGKHPILDGNYIKEIRWGYIEQVLVPQLADVGFNLKIILVHAPQDVVRQRLRVRGAEHDKFKVSSDAEWQKLIEEQPPVPPEIELYPHIKVDSTRPLSVDVFREAIEFLQK